MGTSGVNAEKHWRRIALHCAHNASRDVDAGTYGYSGAREIPCTGPHWAVGCAANQ